MSPGALGTGGRRLSRNAGGQGGGVAAQVGFVRGILGHIPDPPGVRALPFPQSGVAGLVPGTAGIELYFVKPKPELHPEVNSHNNKTEV